MSETMNTLPEPPGVVSTPLLRRTILGWLRGMLPQMLLDGVCPFLLYLLLSSHFPPSSVLPLGIALIFPMLGNILNLVRHRRLDAMGILVVLGFLITIVTFLLGGSPQLLLITRTLMVPAMGLACLVSLFLPRPLSFYMLRQLVTGENATRVAPFNALWQYPFIRFAHRLMSLVWGLTLAGEFTIRVILVFTLSVAQVLALWPVVTMGASIGLMLWNLAYGWRVFRRVQALSHPLLPAMAGLAGGERAEA